MEIKFSKIIKIINFYNIIIKIKGLELAGHQCPIVLKGSKIRIIFFFTGIFFFDHLMSGGNKTVMRT